ncbi:hypothetical protein Bca52824_047635 [Brassica carinata]|uniref:Uncharacterized protein n=1 Tax=Brassica carinata TaxID=52824 RepID=A0A8X7USB1_BRACI|nr:hypothetical protein Bca52824_047635 [Brassica carinata]
MPLPFEELQGLGFLDSSYGTREDLCCVVGVNNGSSEPTSVLDSSRSPSPFLSSSTTTLSSSHGGPGAAAAGKCNQMAFEDLDGVLSGSPGQEQSIFRLIMSGDVVDPALSSWASTGFWIRPESTLRLRLPLDEPPPEEEDLKFQITTDPNPCFFSGGSSPPAKRLNSGQPVSHQWGFPFSDPGHPFLTPPPKLAGTETTAVITEQLFNAAAELTGTTDNNPVLAQGILARLNHNLNNSINPKPPFQRAALHVTESLQSLLQHSPQPSLPPPHTLLLKIAAHRAFSETSPFLQFVNFTANQTILESLEGFDRIHIVDFDVGYGGQWSSLIQELAGRRNRSLKVTSFSSPSTVSDEFELRFTEENLRAFAGETGVTFEMELMSMETLLNPPLSLLRSSEKEEAIAVNLPISSVVSGYLPLILRFLKQISPNVVVCSDGIPDDDAQFPNSVIDALRYYTSLVESLESPNNQEAVTSIERFCVQPWIQRLLTNRYRWMEKSPPWRSLFGQCGFAPVGMSQTAETQAEYLLQRNPMRGFHLEKRQSSLVLCWQKKELVAVSAWKC